MARSTALPSMSFTLEMSDHLAGLTSQDRHWNADAKVAMFGVLTTHHQQRIPGHFRIGAHGKYGYAQRRDQTRAVKSYRWHKPPELDLVRSGMTSRMVISQRQITSSGSFQGGGLRGRLTMELPFPATRDATKPGRVTIEQMQKEISAVTDDEQTSMASEFGMRLSQEMSRYAGGMRPVYRKRVFASG